MEHSLFFIQHVFISSHCVIEIWLDWNTKQLCHSTLRKHRLKKNDRSGDLLPEVWCAVCLSAAKGTEKEQEKISIMADVEGEGDAMPCYLAGCRRHR